MAKTKYPRELALSVARELCTTLKPVTAKLIVAGSLRRRKAEVGDVEILYIPTHGQAAVDSLFAERHNLTDLAILDMVQTGVLKLRENKNGGTAFGPKNKLMVHVASGVPVDLFAATEANWFNYLVCRTGPADHNTLIAMKAQEKGWKWNPYGEGFSKLGETRPMDSEEAVFAFLGLPYLQPWERV